jgi:hypothetical protein
MAVLFVMLMSVITAPCLLAVFFRVFTFATASP